MVRALLLLAVFVLTPPTRYQHDAKFTVVTRSVEATNAYCRAWGTRPDAYACELWGTVNIPNPCEWANDEYAELLCHEQGHVLGWPADHGN